LLRYIICELNSFILKAKELEDAVKVMEPNIKLMRIEIINKKGKLDNKV